MKNKLTYSDVLEETVVYYTEDPSRRALEKNSGVCSYYTQESKMCAVGRCMKDPKLFQDAGAGDFEDLLTYIPLPGTSINPKSIGERRDDYETEVGSTLLIPRILKNKYKHLNDADFWSDLQFFHDTGDFWDKKGLTKIGKDYYETLKKRYAES